MTPTTSARPTRRSPLDRSLRGLLREIRYSARHLLGCRKARRVNFQGQKAEPWVRQVPDSWVDQRRPLPRRRRHVRHPRLAGLFRMGSWSASDLSMSGACRLSGRGAARPHGVLPRADPGGTVRVGYRIQRRSFGRTWRATMRSTSGLLESDGIHRRSVADRASELPLPRSFR